MEVKWNQKFVVKCIKQKYKNLGKLCLKNKFIYNFL